MCHNEQLPNVYRATMFAFDLKGRERVHIRTTRGNIPLHLQPFQRKETLDLFPVTRGKVIS